MAKPPQKPPLLHARQETAGMTARARSTAKYWLKQEDYSNICAVTDQLMELTLLQATNDQLLQGLVLTPKSFDLRSNFHLSRAFEVFALQRGQRERGLCNSLEK